MDGRCGLAGCLSHDDLVFGLICHLGNLMERSFKFSGMMISSTLLKVELIRYMRINHALYKTLSGDFESLLQF